MLVLTRKQDQSIMIGGGIEVRVVSIDGKKVKLGITAPDDVKIFRQELLERAVPLPAESDQSSLESVAVEG